MSLNTESVQQIKFGTLPLSDHAIAIGDVVIVDDNLDENLTDKRIGAPITKDIPSKLMMAFCILCLEGELNFMLNQKEYSLTRNTCLICMPGAIGEHIHMSPDCRIIIGAISQRHFGKAVMQSADTIRKWLIRNNGLGILSFSEKVREAFTESYLLFKKLFTTMKSVYTQDAAVGFFHFASAIFASCMDEEIGAQEEVVSSSRKKELMMKFLNDVHEFCATERSVAFYAGRCCLSPKYFARIITEMMGKKPGDVIKASVILEAKVLLVSNDFSVQQVSDKLHFPNSSFFCKYFKSATGCSPRQYQLYGEKAVVRNNMSEDQEDQ